MLTITEKNSGSYIAVSESGRPHIFPKRTSSGGSASARSRSVHSPTSSSGSRGYRSGGSSESWSDIRPPYGPSEENDDDIEPSDSASRSRQPSSRRRESRESASHSRPAPTRRHSSRRSVLQEEVAEVEEPQRRSSRRHHHSSRSSRHPRHERHERHPETRRIPSDQSSSTVASRDEYPYGHHGRYPPPRGYHHPQQPPPAAPVVPPQSHGGYPPSIMTSAPGYHPDAYQQALVMTQQADPFAYTQANPFSPHGPQPNPFSPMGSTTASSYFGSEPLAPSMSHPAMSHHRPPMGRPQSYAAPQSHYAPSEVMSPSVYGPPSAMGMPPYGYGMHPGFPGYPMMPGWPYPPPAQPSPAPSAAKEEKKDDKKNEEMESMKEYIKKREEALAARENAINKRAEEEAAAIALAKAKDEEDKKKKEEIAAASKKAKEEAEKKAEDAAKKLKEEHDKKLKEIQTAKEEAEKKQKEFQEEAEKHKPAPDAGKQIRFKDAVGRKFSFPYQLCKTWKGMESLIRQAFLHVDVIGDHVRAGHYDLTGPDGEIILPQVWDTMVQPEWEISMHMWPMEEDNKKKEDKLAADAALFQPFAGLGLEDFPLPKHHGHDKGKKDPHKKSSKKIVDPPGLFDFASLGPPPPPPSGQGHGVIPPPPPFPPAGAMPGPLPGDLAGLMGYPPRLPEEKKKEPKRSNTSRSKSSKEIGGFSAWMTGSSGRSSSKKK